MKRWSGLVLLVALAMGLSGCGFGGKSSFELALESNEKANTAIQANYVSYSNTSAARDAKVFEILKDNPAAAVAYACAQNGRDIQVAQAFRINPVRIPMTGMEAAAQIVPDVASTAVTGILGYEGLRTLGRMMDHVGSNYYFDASGDLNVQEVGNAWDISTVGDSNVFTRQATFNGPGGGEIPEEGGE